jgi:hypothetical protein
VVVALAFFKKVFFLTGEDVVPFAMNNNVQKKLKIQIKFGSNENKNFQKKIRRLLFVLI